MVETDQQKKKLDALEQARRRYVQAVYGYLPCLQVPGEVSVIHEVIDLIEHVAKVHEAVSGVRGQLQQPVQQASRSVAEGEPLTDEEQYEIANLVRNNGISVYRDPDTQELTMTHPLLAGIFHPLNEREVLDVARDIAQQAGGTV